MQVYIHTKTSDGRGLRYPSDRCTKKGHIKIKIKGAFKAIGINLKKPSVSLTLCHLSGAPREIRPDGSQVVRDFQTNVQDNGEEDVPLY